MNPSGLPASRIGAISVISVAAFSALLGSTPGKNKRFALAQAVLSNVWAVASSVLTFKDLWNDHDLEPHVRFFVFLLLLATIFSSSTVLWGYAYPASHEIFKREFDGDSWGVATAVLFVPLLTVLFGLGALCVASYRGCDDRRLEDTHFCAHSKAAVWGACVVAFVVFFVMFGLVLGVGDDNVADGALQTACKDREVTDSTSDAGGANSPVTITEAVSGDLESPDYNALRIEAPTAKETQTEKKEILRPHSPGSAMMARSSALAKVCLLGVYWFLVDDDWAWEPDQAHIDNMNLWVTGQYAKHGATILNLLLNQLPC